MINEEKREKKKEKDHVMEINDLLLLFARIDSFQSIKNGSLRFAIRTKNKRNSYDNNDDTLDDDDNKIMMMMMIDLMSITTIYTYTYNIMSFNTERLSHLS